MGRMEKKKILTTIFLGVLIALFILEYMYIPLFGVKPGNEAIPFWQHPPQAIIFHGIYLISPALVKPANFLMYWCVGFGIWLGFRQVSAENVLGSPSRSLIFEKIRANPGIYFNELCRETGLNRGSLRYHLALMRMTGKVSTLAMGGSIRYFENSGRFSGTEQKVLKYLRNNKERAIFAHLMDNPETTRGDLEKILGISGAAVTWHTNRLCDAGMLTVARSGKTVRYLIDLDARTYLEKYLAAPTEKSGIESRG